MKETMGLQRLCCRSKSYLKKNSSIILTCVGAVGVIVTAITAVKATPKALKLLEEAKEEKGEELTKIEVVKVAGPTYIPSALFGISTIACIFGANVLNKKQQAAITSAYALADNAYKEYRNKVKELLGEETDDRIIDAIAMDKRKEDVIAYTPGLGSLDLTGEQCLFYDEYRGKYFEATMNEVINAEYHLNRNFSMRGCANLNEFYSFLGLEDEEFGDILGWNSWKLTEEYEASWIDFSHRKVELEDGMECFIIEFVFPPTADYEEF